MGKVLNLTIKLINKTIEDINNIEVKLVTHKGKINLVGGMMNIKKQDLKEGTFFIEINKKDLNSAKEKLKIGIYSKNCYEWAIAEIAIMLGGFVTVPFYANLVGEALNEVIELSEIQFLFVGKFFPSIAVGLS